jgi:hypothetical protein
MKPRKSTSAQWTANDLDGEAFGELIRRQEAGELRIHGWGVGRSNALWCVSYSLLGQGGASPSPALVPAGKQAGTRSGCKFFNSSRMFPKQQTKKVKTMKMILALMLLGCSAAAQGIPERTIAYKPIADKPLTNMTVVAYKPLPGSLALTNAPPKLQPGQQSPYGSWAQGYSGAYGADFSYGYHGPYMSGSGWGYNNGIVSGYGFTVHSSSRRGL